MLNPINSKIPFKTDKKWSIRFEKVCNPAICKAANAARVWYILIVVLSVFGGMVIDSRFFGSGDASIVMAGIQEAEWLYRLGIASFLAGQICQVLVMLALCRLFQSVDREQTVPIAFVVVLAKFAPVIFLNKTVFSKAFEPTQLQALSVLFIELQNYGIIILEVFWGLWLLPLGLLVHRSGLFPKLLGILLLVGCLGHILMSFTAFVPAGIGTVISVTGTALSSGELPFFLWLILFGARSLVRVNMVTGS